MKLVALSSPSAYEFRVQVTLDSGKEHELYLESNLELVQTTDPWLYLLLPVCLRLGEDLEIRGSLSEEAMAAFERAKQELLTGYSYMLPMTLVYNQDYAESDKTDNTKSVGSFFSGGLDSAYSAETEKEVDSLICVWGFDIAISNPTHWNLTKDLVESYCSSLGKRPVTVKTNVRAVFNDVLEWGRDYHGSALAGVGSALSKHFKAVYIAAGYKRVETNWGHFPALAKAFSTPAIQIGESGPVRRIDKADALANNPRTPQIRVCYRNVKGLANCGACKKCVRTRLEFDLINAPNRPLGLETRPTTKELLATQINRADYRFYVDAIKYARAKGSKSTIAPLLAVSQARLRSKTQSLLAKLIKKKDPIQGNPRISNQKP